MMNLDRLFFFTERLRREAIGDPAWIVRKKVFEYGDHSVKVVAVLKLLRAAQGVTALHALCKNGLFIDMGVIYRCVSDCLSEVYFLLEEFPKTSPNVDKFVRAFFENTIDGFLSGTTEPVPTKKIRSAVVRVLKGRKEDHETRKRLDNVYETFSGYVHANYAHIMQTYGGRNHHFYLAGITSETEREKWMQYVELAHNSVLYSIAFTAQTLRLDDLHREVVEVI